MKVTNGDILKILNDKRTGTNITGSFAANLGRAGYVPVDHQEGTGTHSTRYYKFDYLLYIFALSQLTKFMDVKRLVQIPARERRKDLAISIGEYLANHMSTIQKVAMAVFMEARRKKGGALAARDLSPLMPEIFRRLRKEERERTKKLPQNDMPWRSCLFEEIRFRMKYEGREAQSYEVEFFRKQEDENLAGTSKEMKVVLINHFQNVHFTIDYMNPSGMAFREGRTHEVSTDSPWWFSSSPVMEYPYTMAAAGLFWVLSDFLSERQG